MKVFSNHDLWLAHNVDDASKGVALRDFRRVIDDADFPEEAIAPYDSGLDKADESVLVFKPDA